MSENSKSKLTMWLAISGVVAVLVLFVVGLNIDRDTFKDPQERAWEEYLLGEWAYVTGSGVDDLIGFAPNRIYAQVLADPQFADLRRESTYQFVEVGEETVTIELLPELETQSSLYLDLTRVDDVNMSGRYWHDEEETVLYFRRRR